MADYRELELLVAKIQRDLAPTADVLHNQYLLGRKSGRQRQIDVLVKDQIGQYEIQIVIDCKDYKKPVDVKGVEEFFGLLDDVGAQKGVLVCPAGFSAAAKVRAEGYRISLYSPVDTDPHKWKVNPEIPVFCDFREAGMSFGISASGGYPFMMPYDFQFKNIVTDAAGKSLGTMFELAIQKWNNGDLPTESGQHLRLQIFWENPHMDNGYKLSVPVNLWVGLEVRQSFRFGMIPITKISGFKDEIGGGLITNAFEVGILNFEDVYENWKEVDRLEDCELPPVLGLRGLIGWDVGHSEHNSISARQ